MKNRVLGFILFVSLSNLTVLISYILGLSSALLAIFLLLLKCTFYFLINRGIQKVRITRLKILGSCYLFASFLIFTIHGLSGLRELGILIDLIVTALLFNLYVNRSANITRLLFFLALVNCVFGILSSVVPIIFYDLALSQGKSVYTSGRSFGLFFQPNLYGHYSFLLSVLGSYYLRAHRTHLTYFLILCGISIIMSGSRATILIFVFFLLGMSIRWFLSYRLSNLYRLDLRILSLLLVLPFILILVSPKKSLDVPSFDRAGKSLFDTGLKNDASIVERRLKRELYYPKIYNSLLVGYGLGAQNSAQETGLLRGAAHNQFLELLYQGGLFLLLMFVIPFYVLFFRYPFSIDLYKALFLLTTIVLLMVSSQILNMGIWWVCLNMFNSKIV